MATIVAILVLSYLVGSIPGSVWAGQALHSVDVRNHGSGNAGATNAFRVLGWQTGVLATLIDLGKGLLAAGLIASLRLDGLPAIGFGVWEADVVIRIWAGMAAIVGHMFPVWAKFKGGKGVNTSAGVLFALTPITTLIALGAFALMLLAFRYVSLASITAAVVFPSAVAIRKYAFGIESLDASLLIFGVVLGLAVILAHLSNIERLLKGEESRISSFQSN